MGKYLGKLNLSGNLNNLTKILKNEIKAATYKIEANKSPKFW